MHRDPSQDVPQRAFALKVCDVRQILLFEASTDKNSLIDHVFMQSIDSKVEDASLVTQ